MKTLKTAALFGALLLGAAASSSALAWHGGHGFYGPPRVGIGFSFGGPLYSPWYYPPPIYYPLVVTAPAPPPVYVESGEGSSTASAAQSQGYWYYCAESKTYYPYVKECPGGWQRVPPRPN